MKVDLKAYLKTLALVLVPGALLSLAFVNTSSPHLVSGELSSWRTLELRNFGPNSVVVAQFPRNEHKHLFLARELDTRTRTFNLSLGEKVQGVIERKHRVFDTSQMPAIHDGSFRIRTAYDPSLAWFRGRYWVAFECASSDFARVTPRTSASTCMGPLDDRFNVIPRETYVLVLGGRNPSLPASHTLSASVPKLLADGDRLFLYWSSVAITENSSEIQNRYRNQQAYDRESLIRSGNASVVRDYETFKALAGIGKADYTKYKSVVSFDVVKNQNPSLVGNRSEADFYRWQSATLGRMESFHRWESQDSGIHVTTPVEHQFKSIETYGAEILFENKASGVRPYVSFARKQTRMIAFAWQTEHFSKVLSVKNTKGFETVADVFDIKRINGKVYATAAVGGSYDEPTDPMNPYRSKLPCLTPVIGFSSKGCYRLELYTSTSPLAPLALLPSSLNTMSGTFPDQQQNGYVPFGGQRGHEYSRFFADESGRLNLTVKFMGLQNLRSTQLALPFRHPRYVRSRINEGEWLSPNEGLISPNGEFILTIEHSGYSIYSTASSLVVRRLKVATTGTNPALTLQATDGHLVYYPTRGQGTGARGTGRHQRGSHLILQNDGNLVQYGPDRRAVWDAFSQLRAD